MIKKEYLKSKPECKVTFKVPKSLANGAQKVNLVGDFNNWSEKKDVMKPLKNGDFSLSINLPSNNEYQFRYLLDGTTWKNDDQADKYVANNIDGDNFVVSI
jgi:1,4-alpha-glucan branching enzyme